MIGTAGRRVLAGRGGGLLVWLIAVLCFLSLGPRTQRALAEVRVPLPAHPAGLPWPTEAWPRGELPVGLDRAAFEEATSSLFEGVGRGGLRDTRALLIIRGGRIVYERYAEGFGPTSRFHSWSMAKSVTQSLVGILVRMGKLVVDAPAPVPAWQAPGDPRGEVSLDDLLHMTSGLGNEDGFESGALFVGELMFGRGARNPAAFAEAVDVEHPPGTHWAYSTGTSMILAAIAGRAMGEDERARLEFMRRELFLPLGMKTVVPEFDSAGQFMGGGFVHASAEDWARFGYLYLRDGIWDDRRILPEGWVDYCRTPAPADNNGVQDRPGDRRLHRPQQCRRLLRLWPEPSRDGQRRGRLRREADVLLHLRGRAKLRLLPPGHVRGHGRRPGRGPRRAPRCPGLDTLARRAPRPLPGRARLPPGRLTGTASVVERRRAGPE